MVDGGPSSPFQARLLIKIRKACWRFGTQGFFAHHPVLPASRRRGRYFTLARSRPMAVARMRRMIVAQAAPSNARVRSEAQRRGAFRPEPAAPIPDMVSGFANPSTGF